MSASSLVVVVNALRLTDGEATPPSRGAQLQSGMDALWAEEGGDRLKQLPSVGSASASPGRPRYASLPCGKLSGLSCDPE